MSRRSGSVGARGSNHPGRPGPIVSDTNCFPGVDDLTTVRDVGNETIDKPRHRS